MKTLFMIVLLSISAFASLTAYASPPPLDIDDQIRRLPLGDRDEITLRFRGNEIGFSTLTLLTDWASATHAERGIEGLEVLTTGARLEDTD